jgi:hypothetical protein
VIARAALACASVLTVAGCGTAADSDQARAATERFYAAVRQGDGRAACAELSPATRSQLVKDEKQPDCAKAVLKLSLHGTRVGSVEVYATSAVAKLVGGDTVFLGDTKNGWRLEAVGCKPAGSGPLDCEEQA